MVKHIITFILLLALVGCAAALVPYSSDPKQKLSDAYWLFDESHRPLPAERLILEAINIYETKKDNLGLAEAYKAYAIFLRSYAVDKYSAHYVDKGFKDSTISFNERYQKSIEYLERSESIFQQEQRLDDLTNIYLHMGFTYLSNKQVSKGCDMFTKSLDMNKLFTAQNPNAKLNLGGYKVSVRQTPSSNTGKA